MQFIRPLLDSMEHERITKELMESPWYKRFQEQYGSPPDLNSPDYNYFEAWKAGVRPQESMDHFYRDPLGRIVPQYRWSDDYKRGSYLSPDGKPFHDKKM